MGLYEGLAKWQAGVLRRQLEAKNDLKLSVVGEENLHVCAACGCNLALKVQVPIVIIAATTEFSKLHPECWIIKEAHLANIRYA